MILDLTTALTDAKVDWTARPRDVSSHFRPRVRRLERGLYLLYFENDGVQPVYDKNRNFSTGGTGTLVIHARGASLKPGKFEKGFIARRRQDAHHLHRGRKEQVGPTFAGCLKLALVLDLAEHRDGVAAARQGERVLRNKLDAFIAREDFAHSDATRRGDWRRLNARIPVRTLELVGRRFLRATAEELDTQRAGR